MDTIKEKIAKAQNSSEYIRLSNYYKTKSYMQITGVSRLEMAHSSMIAWLLNPKAHALVEYPLKKFLSLISVALDRQENLNAELSSDMLLRFSCEDYLIYDIEKLATEFPLQGKDRRLDVLIEAKLRIDGEYFTLPIIIENKIKSQEHDTQTQSYYDWARERYKGEKYLQPIFVYLTPSKTDNPSCKQFIRISYQDMIDYVIEPSMKRCKDEATNFILKDYLRCLTFDSLMNNDTDRKVKGDVIMGYSSEEKQLLKKFWDNNKDLIYAVAEIIETDDESEKNAIQTIKDGLNQKDYTKYKYGENVYNKRGLVCAVISDYIKANDTKSFEEICEAFKGLIISETEYQAKKAEKKFTKFEHANKTYYISNQIKTGGNNLRNINKFLDRIRELHIEVEVLD